MKRNDSPMSVTVWPTVVILFCLWQATNSVSASLILNPPVNQTVPINSTAAFSCRVTGFLVWEIDAVQIKSDTTRDDFCNDRGVCVNGTLDTSPDETESVLLVAAIENNGSEIRCVASNTTTSRAEESEIAVLKTFSRPASPTDLLSSPVRPLHLNLSWSAPFIFPGTKTSYTISIRNVNTSEEIKREGLEETHYIFNGTGGSSACDVYQFSVAAVNSAGSSDRSRDIQRRLPTRPNIEASIGSLTHDVVLEDESRVASIKISFEPAGMCGDPAVASYGVILHGDNTNVTVGESRLEDGRVNIVMNNAEVNARYNFSIMASNSVGNSTSEDSECYTTDVQDPLISMKDDDIVVSCYFAGGSQARGCQIQLNSPMENITLNISRNDACGIVIEPSHSLVLYEICALDWEADGTIGELCIPVTVDLSQSASCGDPPGPESSKPKSQLLIGVAIGGIAGFLLILIAVVAAILLMSCYCMRARQVRAKSNDYGNGYRGGPGKYKKGVNVEVIPSYHPATTERSDSQATTVTILHDSLPPVYDAIQNYSRQDDQDSGEKDYSGLTRTISQLSPTARADFDHDPQYSALNQVPTYAVLETNSVPLGILPHHQEAYCEIDDLKRHESTAAAVSVSDPSTVPENERLYSEIPSAGTTV